MLGGGLLEAAVIVSFLEEGSDIHWLPVRLFTGGLVTVKHVFAIAPRTWDSLFFFFFSFIYFFLFPGAARRNER